MGTPRRASPSRGVDVADLSAHRSAALGVRGRRSTSDCRRRTPCPHRIVARSRVRFRRGRTSASVHSSPADEHAPARISYARVYHAALSRSGGRRLPSTARGSLVEELAARVARQHLGEVDGLRQLEAGEALTRVGDEFGFGRAAPAARTTTAFTASPHFSSGIPMTATSPTAGCVISTFSTSVGYTFSRRRRSCPSSGRSGRRSRRASM